ncbi:hypothetical protein NSA19_01760 [Actinomyces bowdenii]|uniref:hypothetical protein n=1 Tax=Actinomyces bowdenii TaxID=131109 RepID=UPI00214C3AF5|nr:hypothetical protein [Actinomyces bowdenii]MCR2051599.1 hypothetical protein [Actinomyces bowdenii]
MSQARYEPRHLSRLRRPTLRTANGSVALGGSCLMVGGLAWAQWPPPATVAVLTVIIVISLGLVTAPPSSALRRGVMPRGSRRAWAGTMILAMSPAILLGIVFPIVAPRIAGNSIGGVGLQSIILSVSVVVPWISQVVGNPVYRLLGDAIGRGPAVVLRRYCSAWPALFLWALIPSLLVALTVAAVTGWSARAMAAHLALLIAHVVFVQSLIISDISGRRRLWAVGWLVYALALLAVPAWWFLPPLLGTVSQLLAMGRTLGGLLRPITIPAGPLVQDMARGFILGGVLWSDKFLLFLSAGTDFHVALVYLSLQPAVVAYCYYFSVTSPRVNTEVALFQALLKERHMEELRSRGQQLRHLLNASLVRACAVGIGGAHHRRRHRAGLSRGSARGAHRGDLLPALHHPDPPGLRDRPHRRPRVLPAAVGRPPGRGRLPAAGPGQHPGLPAAGLRRSRPVPGGPGALPQALGRT